MQSSKQDSNFYEIYFLLIKNNIYQDTTIARKVAYETQKTRHLVEFDYRTVFEYFDDPNQEVLGFYHTHPPNFDAMSSIDIQTMTTWVQCLGKDLYCLIDVVVNDIPTLKAWKFSLNKLENTIDIKQVVVSCVINSDNFYISE